MSRFGEGEEWFPGQFWLWQANLERALGGARGQAALAELEEALLALPEPKLISGHLALKGQVCTVGALALHKRTQVGEDREAVLADLEKRIPEDNQYYGEAVDLITMECGIEAGLTGAVAYHLGTLNDDYYYFGSLTPEERYEAVLSWCRRAQGKEQVAA